MRTAALAAAMTIAAFTAACGPGEIKVNATDKDGASVSANLGGEAGDDFAACGWTAADATRDDDDATATGASGFAPNG